MNVRGFPVGPLQANCYVLDDGRRAVVVDPGGEPDEIQGFLGRHGLDLVEIWLTHAHFDHVGGLSPLLAAQPAPIPVRMHPDEQPIMAGAVQHAATFGIEIPEPPGETVALRDDEQLDFAGTTVHVLHTPGHAPGHVAFWIPSEETVLAGDALFRGSVGRTDLPYADHGTLIASIRRRLLTLPDATMVLPGHGPFTQIAQEAATNPFLVEPQRTDPS